MSAEPTRVCRALYIEDTREDQRILQAAISFTRVPLELMTASSAQTALDVLAASPALDVLLLDWNLPAVSGIEFLATLRDMRPELPIVILTGEPGTVDIAHAAELGARMIVQKPLVLDQWEQLAIELFQHYCNPTAAAART